MEKNIFKLKIKNLNNNRGFTLIELIIAFALAGIIASVAFSLNVFSNNVMNIGEKKYNVQSEINLASEQITRNIRFATGVQLLDSSFAIPAVADIVNDDSYLYIETDSGKQVIKLRDKTGTRNLIALDTVNCTFTTTSSRSVSFSINGTYQGQQFEINSEVTPQNMLVRGSTITNSTGVKLRIQRDAIPAPPSSSLTVTVSPMSGVLAGTMAGGLSASGGSGTYTYNVSSTSRLPYGVTINANSGLLQGSPIEAGKLSVTFLVEDTSTPVKSKALTADVNITDSSYITTTDPKVENVNINYNSGTGQCGVTYNYSAGGDGQAEGNTQVTWYRSNSADGSGLTTIETDTYPNIGYTATSADLGKYLYVKVVPYDSGAHGGYPVFSRAPIYVASSPNAAPMADNVKITDIVTIGSTVTGSYTYSDAEGDIQGISTFKWYRSTKQNGSDKVLISGATSNQYLLKNEDKDMYIYFEVTPVALTGTVTGIPKISANIGKIKQ